MTDREIDLIVGSLLHDIGKVIYRTGEDGRKHSKSGYEFAKNEMGIKIPGILDQIRYHHADALKEARLEKDSPAYITYIADNIASAADRRMREAQDTGFEISAPLESVFNILNHNNQKMYYKPGMLDPEEGIHYPSEEKIKFDEHFYARVKANLVDNFAGIEWSSQEYLNSLLEVLEANLTFVPSSTAKGEVADVSLFDHLKLTAAVASCIFNYLSEEGDLDYRERLWKKAGDFYGEKAFCLYSMDVSGIQDFIYTITSKNALKTLRARSFYLEIMMEHMTDCLLEKLHLSRANLVYSGGGHCYILMPNTKKAKDTVESYMAEVNRWLLDKFQISLYVAWGYAPCSAENLKNVPTGSYGELFHTVSEMISAKKSHRYSAQEIIALNAKKYGDYTRECAVCKKIAKVDENGVCPVCRAIGKFSNNILNDEFFSVILQETEDALPLPSGYYLVPDSEKSLRQRMERDQYFVRAYGKNKMVTGRQIATKLWVGDYAAKKTFEEFAKEAQGIERIAILRADVDNLGHAFVAGFENEANNNRYVTLSRTATLSRQLSLFFKLYINRILEEGGCCINGREKHPRNVCICYSGGDDLFIVGAWNEVVELSVDVRRAFARYTQGTLSLSAGIGLYEHDYPVSAAAREVAELEDTSKKLPEKNAVTVFEPAWAERKNVDGECKLLEEKRGTYYWVEFEEKVLGEKFKVLNDFFSVSEERGTSFIYNLLELLRSREEKINFARYIYILSRLEPGREAKTEQREAYRIFSQKMYPWYKSEEDRRQLVTAIYLYVYLNRKKEELGYERV